MKFSFNGLIAGMFGFTKKHAEQHEVMVKAIEKISNWQHCSFHDGFLKSIDKVANQQVLNTDHIAKHEKRLDEGVADFKEIKKSIASLDKSYALLAQKAEQRRETNGNDTDS